MPVASFSWYVLLRHKHRKVLECTSYIPGGNTIQASLLDQEGEWEVSCLPVTRSITFTAGEERRLGIRQDEDGVVFQAIDLETDSGNTLAHHTPMPNHALAHRYLPPIFSANSNVTKPVRPIVHEIPAFASTFCKTASAPVTAPSEWKILTGTMYDLLAGARILVSQGPGKMVSRGKAS